MRGVIGTIIVGFAKYTSCCGLKILRIRGIPQNP